MNRTMRVCHLITGLETGGAELGLEKLIGARGTATADTVISLRGAGTVGPRLRADGVAVVTLGLDRTWNFPLAIPRLRAAVLDVRPDVLVGWMYHGNLAASLAKRWAPRAPVVWGIRQSFNGYRSERWGTRAVIRLNALMSRTPAVITYNSAVSVRQHEAIGFAAANAAFLPNGYDLSLFHPDPTKRAAVRAECGFGPDTVLIGQVARFHPMKNHAGMIEAFARIPTSGPRVELLLVGRGVDPSNATLRELIAKRHLDGRIHLLGERADVGRLLCGLDLLCSPSSWGEGSPNVVGEAMASGVPCVVTDVGDSAAVVGDTGAVVPPGAPEALVAEISRWVAATPEARRLEGKRARTRIGEHFALPLVTQQFYDRLAALVSAQRAS